MHKHTTSLLAALAAAALLSACAGGPNSAAAPATAQKNQPARPAGGHGLDAFLGSYDANRDGQVTRAEFDAIRLQRFKAADTNGDGVLSEAEYVAEYEGRLKRQYFDEGRQPDEAYANNIKQAHVRFGIVNRARDGKFTWAEDQAIADKTFTGLDTNGDGIVSKADPQRPREQRNNND
ncbi:MAG: EF-hand domain-containing protein [Pseudorhodoferax sp.]